MLARRLGVALAAPSLIAIGLLAGSLLASGGVSSRPLAAKQRATADAGVLSGDYPRVPPSRSTEASVVANVEGSRAIVYRSPTERRAWRRYANPTSRRTPLVFLVRRRVGSWLRVLLPSRPNGSEGWLRAARAELRTNPYSVLVNLREHDIVVRRAGRTLLSAAVGVGRAATPTPTGLYYVTELLRQPNPNGLYGPWAFALSAHSSVLTYFGGGDGQVGIHGTNEPSGIGHTVSHGCIRVRNSVIEKLAAILPLGTPVRIVAQGQVSSQNRNSRLSQS